MKTKILSSFFLLLLLGNIQAQNFKTIGYLPYYRFQLIDQIELDKLTHLNLAFANPDQEGNLDIGGQDIRPIVEKAHQTNLQVFISLAGGALTSEWKAAWKHLMQAQYRSDFIHKIIEYVQAHNLQGVDMDLEWNDVDELYSPFVLELRDSLSQHELQMTAALPGAYRYPEISAEALAAFDFINMMVYDLTGAWDPDNPGPHSPYSFATTAIDYWQEQGVLADKLTLGVPFYGYDFDNGVTAFTYRSMVSQNPDYAYQDQVGLAYYNGIPTVKSKTELALKELSGIMIWELGQDAFNEFSLLKAIHEVVTMTVSIPAVQQIPFRIYPNPFKHSLSVENPQNDDLSLWIHDLNGRILFQNICPSNSSQQINVEPLPAGFYLLRWRQNGLRGGLKIIKQ